MTPRRVPLSKLAPSEAAFQTTVLELCRLYRWHTFHPYDSRRSAPGWPDLAIFGHGVFFLAELKSEKGYLSLAQRRVIGQLRSAGVVVYVWKPSDMPDIQRVLTQHLRRPEGDAA